MPRIIIVALGPAARIPAQPAAQPETGTACLLRFSAHCWATINDSASLWKPSSSSASKSSRSRLISSLSCGIVARKASPPWDEPALRAFASMPAATNSRPRRTALEHINHLVKHICAGRGHRIRGIWATNQGQYFAIAPQSVNAANPLFDRAHRPWQVVMGDHRYKLEVTAFTTQGITNQYPAIIDGAKTGGRGLAAFGILMGAKFGNLSSPILLAKNS